MTLLIALSVLSTLGRLALLALAVRAAGTLVTERTTYERIERR